MISVGPLKFKTKSLALKHASQILNAGPVGRVLSASELTFIRDLLDLHPRAAQKIGGGVVSITIEKVLYGRRGFILQRVDGSRTDFSYRRCLETRTQQSDFLMALRHTVDDQIFAARDEFFGSKPMLRCPITRAWMTKRRCHVDHIAPNTFENLVKRFCIQEGLDPGTVEVGGFGDGESKKYLKDHALSNRWRVFHAANAKLQVVSPTANLSILRHA